MIDSHVNLHAPAFAEDRPRSSRGRGLRASA